MESKTYGYGRGGGRGGFRGRGGGRGRGGFQKTPVTPEQQLKFWEAVQVTCDYFSKKPHKCKKVESFEYFNEYFTETSLVKANKELKKSGKMTLDNHSFKVNEIMTTFGYPHTVISFFRSLNFLGFLDASEESGKIIISVQDDYQSMIDEKTSQIKERMKKFQEPEVLSSSSEDEDGDGD